MGRSLSIGVLILLLLGMTAGVSTPHPALAGDSQTQAVTWTRLESEPWDEHFGCSLAIRTGPIDGSTAVLVRAGNGRDFLFEPLPTVVDFVAAVSWSGASDWSRMGAVLVGSDPGDCPGVASAGLYDAAVLPWGDTAVLVGKQVGSDPTFTDTEIFWPITDHEYSQRVDVGEDGTVAIPYSDGSGIEVLRPSGSTWTQQVLRVPADWWLGVAVTDQYLAVTAWPGDGRVWLFWKSDLAKDPVPYQEIVVPSGIGEDGYGFTIDADGRRIVVGAPGNVVGGGSTGTVHVVTLVGNTWRDEILPQSVPEHEDGFGQAVSIQGGRIAVGAPWADANGRNSGLVYVYDWDGSRWKETKTPTPVGTGSSFGEAVALSAATLASGAPDDGAGSVWVTHLSDRGIFIDDDASVFVNDIEWLAAEGITKGCNPPWNDEFCTDDFVTRGQMAAFLVRALGYTDDGGGDLFIDDDDSIFENDIDKLGTAGVTRGCNPPANNRFCPSDLVTRGQMAAFLVRALGYTDDGGGDLFIDDDGDIFENDIDKLGTAGVTKGCNPPVNDRFCPNDFVTRGQMAAFLHRALG